MARGISDSHTTTTPADNQPASSLNVRARWTTAVGAVVLAGLVLVAVSADGDPPNTGMADAVALVSAFDRFAAGGAPVNVVILSLSNLRGVSSEAVNAGGRSRSISRTGTVGSNVQLLPPEVRSISGWSTTSRIPVTPRSRRAGMS